MTEHIGRVNMDFIVRLAKDPAWATRELERLHDHVKQKRAFRDGQPIPVAIKPNFISPRQEDILSAATSHVMGALNTFVDLFLENRDLQALWGVSQGELDLYRVDPGYPEPIQVARFDGFLNDHDLKFLEFNCDSPGGASHADTVHEAFVEMYERSGGLDAGYSIAASQRCRQLSEALLDAYNAWRQAGHPDRPEHPFTVVTDWRDVPSRGDIDATILRMREHGFDAVFADPRELELDGDDLVYRGQRVDLVYKRVIVKELVNEPEAQALVHAYKAGTLCMVNSPRSVIVGNKKILAALRRPDVLAHLPHEQQRAIQRHVPWTEVLRDEKVDFHGFKVPLRDFALDNKDKLVLKAAQSYGGKEVLLGFETPEETWGEAIDAHLDSDAWVVQELVDIPRELYPRVTAEAVQMELMAVNINPFVFGGRYAGAYTRVSKSNVVNVSAGGGVAPTILAVPEQGEPT